MYTNETSIVFPEMTKNTRNFTRLFDNLCFMIASSVFMKSQNRKYAAFNKGKVLVIYGLNFNFTFNSLSTELPK